MVTVRILSRCLQERHFYVMCTHVLVEGSSTCIWYAIISASIAYSASSELLANTSRI
jgi:hypothetical protein